MDVCPPTGRVCRTCKVELPEWSGGSLCRSCWLVIRSMARRLGCGDNVDEHDLTVASFIAIHA